jgi:hypothetical protein
MKTLFILVSVMVILFIATPNDVEAQKKATNKSNRSASTAQAGKCSVVVRNDLIPNRGVVVVGCDSFGNTPFTALNDNGTTRQDYIPSNGGLIVFDAEMNVIFKWEACSACGGFFSSFVGTKKIKRHNALLVKLVNGPRRDDGKPTPPLVLPLYFNGKEFKLDLYSTNNVLP